MSRFIEDRHEVKLQRRLADIRPWTERAAESLSERFVFALWTLPVLVCVVLWPLLGVVLLPLAAVLILTHRRMRVVLPMRYPAMNAEVDPQTRKQGTGIMFFGNQESSSAYERFKEIWASDDDLRKHMLILGSTGSGKSEALKSLFFNALCWSSGFFIADGKADNKLPTDVFTMVRSVGMDDNLLTLNFLLAGKTPEQVRRSRRRRTHKLNPFTSADSDTIIQMGANMLPKVEGEGKNWQEKALNLWRAMVVALCYKRDTQGFDLSVSVLVEYLSLAKIEELYIEGYDEAQANEGEWSYGFAAIKTYLDSGCPAYKVDKLLAKFNRQALPQPVQAPGAPRPKQPSTDQDSMAFEQHAYRTSQLMPVLNLLDKTYGHIFRDKFPEIDMVDVTLNNRIMTMLIPSLEKSAQEAENLGKLAIACLRVMMSRNLGGGVEGTRMELLESKATNSPYPYLVALDELGYYFSDGIAVIFAQARSLGFCMIPAAQDLEKLTEGNRAAEAGAMMANAVTKIFMRIDDAKKTYEFVQGIVGKATAAVYRNFQYGGMGWRRQTEVDLQEIDRVSMKQLQAMEPGQGLINALGRTTRFRSYYMDSDLKKHRAEEFYLLRFLQVASPTDEMVDAHSLPYELDRDPLVRGERLRSHLSQELAPVQAPLKPSPIIDAVRRAAEQVPEHAAAEVRAIALFQAARQVVQARKNQAGTAAAAQPVGSANAPSPARTHQAETARAAASMVTSAVTSRTPRVAPFRSVPAADTSAAATSAAISVQELNPPSTLKDSLPDLSEPTAQQDWSAGLDGLDLEALLSPQLPFERKAVEELRAADSEVLSKDSSVARLQPSTDDDPVDSFLSGMRFFNMPGVQPMSPEEHPADGQPLGVSNWVARALGLAEAAVMQQSATAHPAERTALGFVSGTAEQLQQIEQILGNPQPDKAVQSLQAAVSAQITPRLSPEVPAQDWEIDQLLQDLEVLSASGGGSGHVGGAERF